MAVEHQHGTLPRLDAIGFANLLDKNSAAVQATDLMRVFREAEQQAGSDDVAVFACELREDTVRLLEDNGYQGDMYLQHPVKRFGQMLVSNAGKRPIDVVHHELAPRAWLGQKSGPTALTTALVEFAGVEQVVGGTHLTHLTGNIFAQLSEAGQLLQFMEQEDVRLLVTDSNRGKITRNGIPIADSRHDSYFDRRQVLQFMRAVTNSAEPRYIAHLWQRLHRAGYMQSEVTQSAVTWVPDPTKKEGRMDMLAARHNLGFSTDHVVTRGMGLVAVQLLSHIEIRADHVPFVATPSA